MILGCGNPVRGDDGAGPMLVRRLWERGLPPNIKLVDGGTSGIDVVFHIEGADRVVIVDTCVTGERPGTVFRVPPDEVEELPSGEEAHLHSIKWYHAIAIGRYLLGDRFPKSVDIFLVEGKNFAPGDEMSQEVLEALDFLEELIMKEVIKEERGSYTVLLDENGYLKIPSDVARRFFDKSLAVAVIPRGMEFYIFPLSNDKQGGLLLKRINSEGERAVLGREMLPPGVKAGQKKAVWDEEKKALVVSLI
ncbi:MAG: hydrogenase maturation protease [Aquificota bacterium]|nr:hydrogenase maturation protease [Aquificota bacterium]